MFGGGSPVFAQMPSYTPVTRGADLRPQIPEPSTYSPYGGQPAQHAGQHGSNLGYPSPQPPLNYPGAYAEPAPSYQSPQPGAAPGYQSTQRAATGYDAGSNYQATDFGGQAYQPFQPAPFRGTDPSGSPAYAASGYDESQNQGYQDQAYQDQDFADQGFAEQNGGDASFPESSFDQNFADPKFANQNFDKPGFADAGFPQPHDASFPEQAFQGAETRGRHDPHGAGAYDGQGGQADQGYELFADEPAQDYGQGVPKIDPRRQLQAFDAIYDQPPQIALGSTEPARRPAQNYHESERFDADFLDGGQLPPPGAPAKSGFSLKSRSAFMVGSALLGAIALGGALAVAYKQSGGGLGSEPPPLVQADNSPVKEVPDQPGGKDFPHKNKLIYDRLQNGDAPEAEKVVPRQEDVAVPAMPTSPDAGAMPMPVASTDAVPPTTQALPSAAPMAVAAAEDQSADGGPRKVKTMVVRPDGSVETPAVPDLPGEAAAAAPPAAPAGAQLAAVTPAPAPEPQPAQAAPQEAAPQPAAAAEPEPKPKAVKPAAQQTAAATPQAGPVKYVVQVGSKKNQTEALASFADMQQKYPTLLANYRPIVQKADLGAKGTWYRLRIGPITEKSAASKLCTQLKSQGLADCLVMAQ
jgi:cell division septation protein DedD